MKLTIKISTDQLKNIKDDYDGMFFEVLEESGYDIGKKIKSFQAYEYGNQESNIKRKAENEKLLAKDKLGEIEIAVKDYRRLKFRVISIEPEDRKQY